MATLHVRNVPDPLYDVLRQSAEENGRSIGAETIHVLTGALFGRPRRFPLPGAGRRLRAFDQPSRTAIADAQERARRLGHAAIDPEHVLLALAARPGFVPSLLERHGLDEATLEGKVVERAGRGEGSPEGTLPFAPETKRALELALRCSLQARSGTIRPHHVFMGIAEVGGTAAEILDEAGIVPETIRQAPFMVAPGPDLPEAEIRVVDLHGSAAEWEAQLNELADDYELVQVVGERAVLRRR